MVSINFNKISMKISLNIGRKLREEPKIVSRDGQSNNDCRVAGNRKCNPITWGEYGGYTDGCCTTDEPCGENEGDCSGDSDCLPGLVCGKHNCPTGVGFDARSDCCELMSGSFKISKYVEM